MDRERLVKDWVSIALGGLIGVSAGYQWQEMWLFGLLGGGFAGYLTWMLTEPQRSASAARRAWQSTFAWRPKPDWRMRLAKGFCLGIAAGGVFTLFIGLLDVHGVFSFRGYVFLCASITLFLTLVTVARDYFSETPISPITKDLIWAAILCNPLTIWLGMPLIALYGFGRAAMIGWRRRHEIIAAIGMGFSKGWQFAKSFIILVHTPDFTACGVYALTLGVIVFWTISPQLTAIIPAMIVGGGVGALMRQVVIRTLRTEVV